MLNTMQVGLDDGWTILVPLQVADIDVSTLVQNLPPRLVVKIRNRHVVLLWTDTGPQQNIFLCAAVRHSAQRKVAARP